jgi:hypothetical protein
MSCGIEAHRNRRLRYSRHPLPRPGLAGGFSSRTSSRFPTGNGWGGCSLPRPLHSATHPKIAVTHMQHSARSPMPDGAGAKQSEDSQSDSGNRFSRHSTQRPGPARWNPSSRRAPPMRSRQAAPTSRSGVLATPTLRGRLFSPPPSSACRSTSPTAPQSASAPSLGATDWHSTMWNVPDAQLPRQSESWNRGGRIRTGDLWSPRPTR